MCHVVPMDGPRTRTGASSGPSKRYCSAAVFVSLTRSTLPHLTGTSVPGVCGYGSDEVKVFGAEKCRGVRI
ncbi:hypothetical protein GCM10012286_82790 [Streptomyces lasiicapitis]|uniref:Uncharacterized protein n=1 Tax=Streptomyces lasiicapitis TaxID=1923961 RepID=A0ABQ2MYR5_9ACTN|nr:hypothetical protein GCM10012286_82790 [Streptomyces lasiicapitis]